MLHRSVTPHRHPITLMQWQVASPALSIEHRNEVVADLHRLGDHCPLTLVEAWRACDTIAPVFALAILIQY